MIRIITAAILSCAFALPAQARSHHHARNSGLHPLCNITMPCELPYASSAAQVRVTRGKYVARQLGFGAPVVVKVRPHKVRKRFLGTTLRIPHPPTGRISSTASLVDHPNGCPRVAFCGCGAAVRVFGRPVRDLWLAANWFRFPRTSPAPGTVAVRRHHVFVLERSLGGGIWLAYDANSGGHATRIHARSIAGYTIVDPHG